MEKKYSRQVQKLCKYSSFIELIKNRKDFCILNWKPLEKIVNQAEEKISLLINLVLSIRLTTFLISVITYLVSMKRIAISIILYRLAHWNNSNYIFLLIIIYWYSTRAWVNGITFLNQFSLSVLYNIFLGKLISIIISSTVFIKEQAFNNKFIDI